MLQKGNPWRDVVIPASLGALICLSILLTLWFSSPVFTKLTLDQLLLCWAYVLLGPLGGVFGTALLYLRGTPIDGAPIFLLIWLGVSICITAGILSPTLRQNNPRVARTISGLCSALWYLCGLCFLGSAIT